MEPFFECQPKIVKQLARRVKDQSTREDLLQEIFIKFASRLDTVKHRDNLCAYLYRITDNTIIDYYRRESRLLFTDNEREFDQAILTPAIDNHYKLADCCLKEFINQLSPPYREALTLTELEGQSQKEVAKKLGLSYSGLKSRVQRAREKLKEMILDCCDYEFDKYGNIVGCRKD
jgi:RNA polymerase sigma-70 factor, ECF subfamily